MTQFLSLSKFPKHLLTQFFFINIILSFFKKRNVVFIPFAVQSQVFFMCERKHINENSNEILVWFLHCPLWAFKSFFQFWSQRAIFHSKRPNPHLPLCSGASGCPKLMCELVTFEKNLVAASKKFRFYTIKCSKYQKNLGRKCQF